MSWRNHSTPRDRLPPELGRTVRTRRKALGLIQAELAARAGIALKTVGRLERTSRASASAIMAVERVLGIPPGTLVPDWKIERASIGSRIRALRARKGLTPADIQADLGMTPWVLYRLERNLGPDADGRWLEILDVTWAWQLGFLNVEKFEDHLLGRE